MFQSKFEEKVAALYKLMGWDVQSNVQILGHEIDLLATRQLSGFGKATIAIECKDTITPISLSVIHQIVSLMNAAAASHQINAFVIVTNSTLTREAKELASSRSLICYTVSELQALALGIPEYIDQLANSLHSRTHSTNYIDIQLRDPRIQSKNSYPASKTLDSWLEEPNSNLLIILGGAGSGKTTLFSKFAYDLAVRYLRNPAKGTPLPIFINALSFDSETTVHDAIRRAINSPHGSPSDVLLGDLINSKSLLLVIDGLGEIPSEYRQAFFNEALHYANSRQLKVLMSSRPSTLGPVFESIGAVNLNVHEAKILVIDELNALQISKYLAIEFPPGEKDHDSLRKHLDENPALAKLTTTPLFLTYLVKMAKSGVLESKSPKARVFELCVSLLLKRNDSAINNPLILDPFVLLSDVALNMHLAGTLSIHSEELYEIISRKVLPGRQTLQEGLHELLQVVQEILWRNSAFSYSFVHKSFQEFFLGRRLAEDLLNGNADTLSYSLVGREVLEFITDFDPPLGTLRQLLQFPPSGISSLGIFVENIQALLGLIDGGELSRIAGIQVRRIHFHQIKCFTDITIEFPLDGRGGLTLLVGDNGVGKSTILQGIVLCALGPEIASRLVARPETLIRDDKENGYIYVRFKVSGLMLERHDEDVEVCLGVNRGSRGFQIITKGKHSTCNADRFLKSRLDTGFSGLFVAAYGPWRHFDLTDDPSRSLGEDPVMDRVASLFDPRKLLFNPYCISRLLIGDGNSFRELRAPPILNERVRRLVSQLLSSLFPESDAHCFTENGLYLSAYGKVALSELSDGYRSTLAWVGHLIVHLLSTVEWSDALSDVYGLVLIDEIDLHLHPKWQRIIVGLIRKTFPNVQFISSTHSPLVLADVDTKKGEAVLLRRVEDAVHAETDLPGVRGMRADQILATELFDYIIDRDPTTENALREASVLASKGQWRTAEEELKYQNVLKVLKESSISGGQTLAEREALQALDRELSRNIRHLEEELFGGGK